MLSCTEIREYINNSVSSLFKCNQTTGNFLSITTPFSYPDGDEIELFIEFRNNYFILSDMGETLRYLDTYLLEVTSTQKRRGIVNDLIKSNNLLFDKGKVYAVIKNSENILDAIFNMSQAIIRLSDLLFTMKGQSLAAFEEEFKAYLEDNHFVYEEDYSVETSTHQYTFDFAIEKQNGVGLIKLMNAPKKPSQKPNISRIVQTWFDISTSFPDKYPIYNRITILDDTMYYWNTADYKLIEKLSVVNQWSQKDRILSSLNKIS